MYSLNSKIIISVKTKSLLHFSFITLRRYKGDSYIFLSILLRRVYNTIMLDFCLSHFVTKYSVLPSQKYLEPHFSLHPDSQKSWLMYFSVSYIVSFYCLVD